MAREPQAPGFPVLSYEQVQTGRTVRAGPTVGMAVAASQLATARPSKSIRVDNAQPGLYSCAFTRSSPDVKTLWLAWHYRVGGVGHVVGDWLSVSLTVRDGLGGSVGPSDPAIPSAFAGLQVTARLTFDGLSPTNDVLGGEGWVDLDALESAGLDPGGDWSFDFTITRGGTFFTPGDVLYVDRIQGAEIPRGSVAAGAFPDDDEAGALTGSFNPRRPITAGTVDTEGWLRIEQTTQAAVAQCTQYLSLSWIADVTAAIPKTSSSTFAALSNFSESAGVPMVLKVRVRPKYHLAPPGSNAGELGRFRVYYCVEGGGDAEVQLDTGAAASPYDTPTLTASTWTWSDWVDCELPTDGADQVAELTFRARTTAGVVYLAGVDVEERAA